jgi:hypothetical protein
LTGPNGASELIWAVGMKRSEVRRSLAIVLENRDALLARWKEIHD